MLKNPVSIHSVCNRDGTSWRLSKHTESGCRQLDVPFDCFCRTGLQASPLCAMTAARRSIDTGDPLDKETCQDVYEVLCERSSEKGSFT